MKIYHWLGSDAEAVWCNYLRKCDADAEAMRQLAEADDE